MFRTTKVIALVALMTGASFGTARAADDIYAAPAADDVKSQALQWAAAQNIEDEQIRQQVADLWTLPEEGVSPRLLLDKVAATFAAVDADSRAFVASCKLVGAPLATPDSSLLDRDGNEPFYRDNLRLYFARYLTQRRMYDEALEAFSHLDPRSVVDPAGCLFYKAVCQHQLLLKKDGLETIKQLLSNTERVPLSYNSVATLMQYELEKLRDNTLDEAARRMRDVGRRLDLARGGPRVQKEEDRIVEVLDKIIEKLEQQQGGGGGGGGGGGQDGKGSNKSSYPANDSSIKGQTAPGNVDRKKFRKQGGWGDLPAKEEARAKNELNRKLPPHYKQATEQYFKKIARYRLKTRSGR